MTVTWRAPVSGHSRRSSGLGAKLYRQGTVEMKHLSIDAAPKMNGPRWLSAVFLGCFLGLTGVDSATKSAFAQEVCTRPASVPVNPLATPGTTAGEVVAGTGDLGDFALAARAYLDSITTPDELGYAGCTTRNEGPWKSGNVYLSAVSLDGRVFWNNDDMATGGRKLSDQVYGAILAALGFDVQNPAGLPGEFATVVQTRMFPNPNGGLVPGVGGYAVGYGTTFPYILLAGLHIDESILVDETLPTDDPAVTAAQVVDRATLRRFVEGAISYLEKLGETQPTEVVGIARNVLRKPPWKHGPVYLFLMDPNGYTHLHAGFPDKFEFQKPTDTLRDEVTGELILPQIIAAAQQPRGGFVRYYFDNPDDHSDSAEVPKVTYARQVTFTLDVPQGGQITSSLIVGAGIYGDPDVVTETGSNRTVESVLPQVMRAMTAGTVDAISNRFRQASPGSPPAAKASLGGASTLTEALLANRTALENGTLDLDRLLARSSFTLSLDAAEAGEPGPLRNLTVWGSGDYRSLSGGDRQSVSYDGDVASASLGIDTRLSPELLAGVSVARAQGSVDYTDADARKGAFTATLTSVNPYMGWQGPGGVNLWAAAGYGTGEVELEDAAGRETSDLTQRMIAGGLNVPMATSDRLIEGGAVSLSLKAETAYTWAEVDASGTLAGAELSASRQRLAVEGSHTRKLASGGTLTPSIEIGVRNDGGDGETGSGVEAGGALRYADPAAGLSLEGRARTLLVHSEDHEERGVSGLIGIDPGAAGRGLALSVQPAWGRTAGGVRSLWETGAAPGASSGGGATGRVQAEIGYGLGASGGLGTVTPYAGLGFAGDGARSWRAGTRWEVAPGARLGLAGTWREAAGHADPERSLTLRGVVHW